MDQPNATMDEQCQTKHVIVNLNSVDTHGITAVKSKRINDNGQTISEQKRRVISQTPQWKVWWDPKDDQPLLANKFVITQIQKKIDGYRYQDITKNRYDPCQFVTLPYVIELICNSNHLCGYCHREVQLMYEYVRDPAQWTLDRIDNDFGHNRNNVIIACLSCNLKRRCISLSRYKFTKQFVLTKMSMSEDKDCTPNV